MTRYFYRCPIVSDYMDKYHGISSFKEHDDKWYIPALQEPLLQPMVGDIGVDGGYPCTFIANKSNTGKPLVCCGDYDVFDMLDFKIILRNNLPWIAPESEEVCK